MDSLSDHALVVSFCVSLLLFRLERSYFEDRIFIALQVFLALLWAIPHSVDVPMAVLKRHMLKTISSVDPTS